MNKKDAKKRVDVWEWLTKKSDKDEEECEGCCGPRKALLRGKGGCCGEEMSEKDDKDCECC